MPTGVVDDPHPLVDVRVVDPHVVGVVDHQRGGAVGDGGAERVDLRIAVGAEHERHDLEPGRGRRRGVARVRLDRGDHLVALLELPAGRVVGAGDAGERVRGVRPAAGLEDEPVHPGEAAQDLVEAVDRGEDALKRVLGLVRVELGELRPRRERLAEPRVVLHRAGAEEADPHHPERLLREVQVVAQDVGLRELGQLGRRRAAHRLGDERRRVALDVEDLAAAALAPQLHHERLVPDGRVVAAIHASTSFSAVASRSTSPVLCTSVTQ